MSATPAGRAAPFDRALLAGRRRRALARHPDGGGFLRAAVVEDVADRLAAVKRDFARALDLGSGGRMAAALQARGIPEVVRADVLAAEVAAGPPDLVADEEALPFAPASFDLVVATLSLQAVNDLPGALVQIRRALKPDGLFLATLLGGETLTELRTALLAAEAELSGGAAPRVAPFATLQDLAALLQRAGFALPVADVDRLTVRYDSLFALAADLREAGATSPLADRPRTPLRRAVLLRAAALYAERFADPDGRVRATFEVVSLSGWAPHESQPKPLKPGSATHRLADALKGGG
jgi:SAM-dependent methyltransferase